jgi:hypothetical protein
MARILVEWDTEVTETHKAILDVPDDMDLDEFMREVQDDPHEYLPDAETKENETGADVTERTVTSVEILP